MTEEALRVEVRVFFHSLICIQYAPITCVQIALVAVTQVYKHGVSYVTVLFVVIYSNTFYHIYSVFGQYGIFHVYCATISTDCKLFYVTAFFDVSKCKFNILANVDRLVVSSCVG